MTNFIFALMAGFALHFTNAHAGIRLELTGRVLSIDADTVTLESQGRRIKVARAHTFETDLKRGKDIKLFFASEEELSKVVLIPAASKPGTKE